MWQSVQESSGSIVAAFNRQDAHIGVCNNIVNVILTMRDLTNINYLTIIEYIAKNKQNTYIECMHT